MRHAHRVLSVSAAWLGAAALLPAPGLAAPRPAITMDVTAEDGSHLPAVDVSDLSVTFARSQPSSKPDADKADDTQDNASLMLDTSALSNPALLNWIGKGGENSSVSLKVTGGSQATTYVLSGLTAWTLGASHSVGGGDGQVNVTLSAKHLTINGSRVN